MTEAAAAAKRQSIKKIDSAQMAAGVYLATFEDAAKSVVRCDGRILFIQPELREAATEADLEAAFKALQPMVGKTFVYGLKQKLDDSMAGAEDIAEAIEELKSTWDAILKGEWATRIAGEGVEGGMFARAYAQWKGKSLGDAKAAISAMVSKNLTANQEKFKDNKKELEKITEKSVFVRVRAATLERNPELLKIYDELKAKRKAKASSKVAMDIDTTE